MDLSNQAIATHEVGSGQESQPWAQVCPVIVYLDDARLGISWIEQGFAKESFGCGCIPLGREQEINGLSGGIDCPVTDSDPGL
jgi:hypothetical protein